MKNNINDDKILKIIDNKDVPEISISDYMKLSDDINKKFKIYIEKYFLIYDNITEEEIKKQFHKKVNKKSQSITKLIEDLKKEIVKEKLC